MNISAKLLQKFKQIRVLALDCDGVLTPLYLDTGVIMTKEVASQHTGRDFVYVFESARFSHQDGQGIDLVRKEGISVLILTTQRSGYVQARAWKLGVPLVQNKDKVAGLKEWLKENCPKTNLKDICFVGDSTNDVDIMKIVGVSACVADGATEAKKVADYVTRQKGGDGAVREVCDLIVRAKASQNKIR
ncbi:MAG: HAD hydrolase family protein [Patescibacteria group bacterium]